jgi:hypothetical protein
VPEPLGILETDDGERPIRIQELLERQVGKYGRSAGGQVGRWAGRRVGR